jgi:polyisoprenoid-binding protein YceI
MAGFARVTFERDPSRSGGVGLHVGPTALQRVRGALTFFALACFVALAFAPASHAQTYVVTLDPAQTRVEFALGTTLHTVHGTFQLISGQIHFDAGTGKVSGAIVVDARSADTDNKSRDKKMNQEILESQKYPEIVFTPQQVRGSFAPQKASQLDVAGTFRIHGQDHDFTMTLFVQLVPGSQLQCDTQFAIPYIKWGMKDPSTFLLHANDKVELEIHAIAKIIPDQPAH